MQSIDVKNLDFNQANAVSIPASRRFRARRLSSCSMKQMVTMLLLFPLVALAGTDLDEAIVLALSPYDRNVVIELPGNDMRALSVGQSLEGIDAELVDVLNDRAVFEEIVMSDNGEKRKETVWIYKAVNGVSRVQRLSRHAPASPLHEVTRVISSESKANTVTTK